MKNTKPVNVKRAIPTVRERLDSVLLLHRQKNPGVHIKIATLAKLAGVSRSNLYTSHRELVDEMKGNASTPRKSSSPEQNSARLNQEVARLKKENKLLLYVNLELNEEIGRLRRRIPSRTP